MPIAAPKPCSQPGCGVLVRDGSSRCEQHKQAAWSMRGRTPTKRVTGRRLQRMRQALFQREPMCRECAKHGRIRLATQRDHEIPLAEGGADDETNEQPLCDDCHSSKSQAESQRGRGRAWGGGYRDL